MQFFKDMRHRVKPRILRTPFAFSIVLVILPAIWMATSPALAENASHPDDIQWDAVFGSPGASRRVYTLYIHGDDLYAGGDFTEIGDIPANGLARWDGENWHTVDDGTCKSVNAMLIHDGKLYAGGSFESTADKYYSGIACWDGTRWNSMKGGVTEIMFCPSVQAIEVFQGDIYVGGGFKLAGGKVVRGIARWDGSDWYGLGGGLSDYGYYDYGTVFGLAADDDFLYVAGYFNSAGSVPAGNIARWDGTQWVPMNTIIRPGVRTMKRIGSYLYIGGWFALPTNPGCANNIARWDGSRWDEMGGGTNEMVLSICCTGPDVYVIGNFTAAGNVPAQGIAKWDGTGWTALGSGVDTRGWNFAVTATEAGEVFAGGDFKTAGDVPSNRIARWNNPVPFPSNPTPPNEAGNLPLDVELYWEISGPPNAPSSYDVYLGTGADPPLVAPDCTVRHFDPEGLEYGTTYYWRIVAKDDQGNQATGSLWRFHTEEEITSRLVVSSAVGHCSFASGDTVAIDITIEDNPFPIDAGGLDVTYDPSVLTYLYCMPGDLTAEWQQFECADLGSSIRTGGFDLTSIPPASYGVFARLFFLSNCCSFDSSVTVMLNPVDLVDDLAALKPVAGTFRCETFTADGDANYDGIVTSGDALCAFESYLCFPDAMPNSCGISGWEVRVDVDCNGQITPADALCIFEHWLDGSCSFCGQVMQSYAAPPQDGSVEVSVHDVRLDGDNVDIIIGLAGVPSLDAFGFEIRYPQTQLDFQGSGRTSLTRNFDQLASALLSDGHLRLGGYSYEPVAVITPSDLVELHFRKITDELDGKLTIQKYVDDISGAEAVEKDLRTGGGSRPVLSQYALYQNYPNPFNPGTEIRYEIPDWEKEVHVRLSIFNIEGKPVRMLVDAKQGGGSYREWWDGRNQQGQEVASGVYFYVLRAGHSKLARKLVLLR